MLCPYCSEYISDDVLRCRECHGDIALYRALRAKIEAELGARSHEATSAQAATSSRRANTTANTERSSPLEEMATDRPSTPTSAEVRDRGLPPSASGSSRMTYLIRHAAWTIAICVALLVLSYFLVGVVWRADGLPLRALSILVPLPLGIWYSIHDRPSHRSMLAAAFIVPTLAMAGGRLVAAALSGEPLIGHDHSWQYLLGYWLSIGLSFLTGTYVGDLAHRWSLAHASLAHELRTPTERRRELVARAKQLGPILGPIGTAIASFVTGVGDYVGK